MAGDFNLIYRVADKNNANVDRSLMGQFRSLLNDLELKEAELLGRTFTWPNERAAPTLVRLERVFCTVPWEMIFPNPILQSTMSGISDHCPLVLCLHDNSSNWHRFHFEPFWPRLDGFLEAVQHAWLSVANLTYPFERLDGKFRVTCHGLQAWSQKRVGNVASQLQ